MEKKYLYLAKGILICMVVWGHLGYHTSNALNGVCDFDFYAGFIIPTWMYQTYFMCAFFLISGYFDKTYIFADYAKTVRKLIFPCLFLFIPLKLITQYLLQDDFSLFGDLINIFLVYPWFVVALIEIKLVSYLINKAKCNGLVTVCFGILLHIVGLYSINKGYCSLYNLPYGLLFFLFYYLGKYLDILSKIRIQYYAFIFVGSVLMSRILFGYLPNLQGGFYESYYQIPLSFAIGISGSMFFIKMCKRIDSNELFEYIGKRTLLIYILSSNIQKIIIYLFSDTFIGLYESNKFLAGSFWIIMTFIIPIVIPICIHNLLSVKKLKFMLGK